MTLFSLLLVLAWERLFKFGHHWQIDSWLVPFFARYSSSASLVKTFFMTVAWMASVFFLLWLVKGWLYGIPSLITWIAIALFCLGAGDVRQHYRAYINAVRLSDNNASEKMANELALIHGLPRECTQEEHLRELQNVLVWINFRFYLAPMFWFVATGFYGPVALFGYAFLRAYQTSLARHSSPMIRAQSGVDYLLHCLDWIPVRLVGVVYALLGHGEKALPAWFASLWDIHTPQYQVLTNLAQFSLAREPHNDPIKTPCAAVALAKKVTLVVIVAVALLTICGALL